MKLLKPPLRLCFWPCIVQYDASVPITGNGRKMRNTQHLHIKVFKIKEKIHQL